MHRFLLILVLLMFSVSGFSQEFKQSVGFRAGLTSGFEYRIFSDDINSYRFLLGTHDRGMVVNVLREFHKPDLFEFSDQLVFVYGAGIHVGYERWDEMYYSYNTSYYRTRTAFIAGLDGLAGLEYTFYEVPITLGLEVKPYFDFFGRDMFGIQPFDFAFTARYNF